MNFKKIILLGSLFFLMAPIISATAFTYIDYIKDGNYVFFLVDIEEGHSIEINVTREDSGNFTLFLFDQRPTKSYVKNDKTLNTEIFSSPKTVAHNLEDNPYLNFTAQDTLIHYIEIILVGNGPDTFTINCNKDLTRYYLPIIPSYQIEFLVLALTISIGSILIVYKKRMNK